jgi:hypothetical protein
LTTLRQETADVWAERPDVLIVEPLPEGEPAKGVL